MEDERDLKKTVKKSGEKGLFKKKGYLRCATKKIPLRKKRREKGLKKKKEKRVRKNYPFS